MSEEPYVVMRRGPLPERPHSHTYPEEEIYEDLHSPDFYGISNATDDFYDISNAKERSRFFKLHGLRREEENDCGVYVTEEFHKSDLSNDQMDDSIDAIIRCINTGNSEEREEMIKYVHVRVIKTAMDANDTVTLSRLFDCDHKGIEVRLAQAINCLLLENEIRTQDPVKILDSMDKILPVIHKRTASSESVNTMLQVVLQFVLVLHHQMLSHPDRKEISHITKTNLQGYCEVLSQIITFETDDVLMKLLQSTQTVMENLRDTLAEAKPSRLQLGNWNEELHEERIKKRLSKDFSKMSTLEHFSLMFGIGIQLHKKPISTNGVEFLQKCLHSAVDHYRKKPREESHLYALLLVVVTGVVNALQRQKGKEKEDSRSHAVQVGLCETLNMIFCKQKIKENYKKALQIKLSSLLYHENGDVVSNVLNILNKIKEIRLPDRTLAHIQTILQPLSFLPSNLLSQCSVKTWQQIRGTITGNRHVSLHVFMPSTECIRNGSFAVDTYRKHTDCDPQTSHHYNNLRIMRRLSCNGECENIKRLLAFQTVPLPLFYIAELLSDDTLSSYLLSRRKDRKWISQRTLGVMALDAVKAIKFLHEGDVVHRDIMAASFRRRGATTVLSDFSIAQNMTEEAEHTMQNSEDIPIPVRWSAPESLCEDEYTSQSDIWMLAQLFYEIFTHGCHPYTDLYGYNLDDTMDLVLFHNLKPKWWPCIPQEVHEIILLSVHSETNERAPLDLIQKRMERWLENISKSSSHSGDLQLSNKSGRFPELDQRQCKTNEPERGTTWKLKQLKNIGGKVKETYYNTLSKRKVHTDIINIKESDLTAPDKPIITHTGVYLQIEEPVKKHFVLNVFDKMKSQAEFGIIQHIISFPPDKKPRESTVDGGLTHTLQYRCFEGKSMLDTAMVHAFGDPEDEVNEVKYAEVIHNAVSFVKDMHAQGWILRDICCSTLYRSTKTGKVYMPRLGRFLKVPGSNQCIKESDQYIEDRRNWMPVEVLHNRQFSQASDIYMLAMTIYEFYTAASIRRTNPMASCLGAVPFANIPKGELLDCLYKEEIPSKPEACPQWMYSLMKHCWNRDSTRRPFAKELLAKISAMLSRMSDDLSCANSTTEDDVSCANTIESDISARTSLASNDFRTGIKCTNLDFHRASPSNISDRYGKMPLSQHLVPLENNDVESVKQEGYLTTVWDDSEAIGHERPIINSTDQTGETQTTIGNSTSNDASNTFHGSEDMGSFNRNEPPDDNQENKEYIQQHLTFYV